MFRSKSGMRFWKTILLSHLLGAIAICAILGTAWALYCGFGGRIETLSKQKDEERKLSQRHTVIQAAYSNLKPKLVELRDFHKDAANRIPVNALETEYLQQVSSLANHVGLDIQDFRPGSIISLPPLQCREVQLRCTGDFNSICQFVTQLPKLPRISRITHVTINEPKEAGGKCGVDILIQIIFGDLKPSNTTAVATN
jgi:Tfp pilus assembly protein PilO